MGSLAVRMGAAGSKSLSQDDLEFLMRNTHYDKATILDFYKGFMSDCPEGKLNPDNFCEIYSKCFPRGNVKEFLLSIDVTSSGTPEEKLNWAFSMYDVDGNGWIDLAEMTRIVQSIYKMMGPQQALVDQFETPEKRAEDIFQRMDVNSDGRVTRQVSSGPVSTTAT